MNQSLNNLSILLDSVQRQQNQTNSTLSTMKQMIKAMTKSTKISTGTQVDQSQLQTNVGQIFNKQPSISLALQVAQGMSVNVSSLSNKPNTLIEQLKLKQKQTSHEIYDPKKSVDKPWCLTPILLVFLQNMSKQNEIGRVLPWQYVKQIMNDIYEQRIIMQFQMSTAFVGNMMNFDEFVVFYYMRKYKIRRLAEVKLLEIIISLKYYAKFWSKAEVFCYMLDVMKYIPLSDVNAETNYKFDYYAQHFYFSIYKQLKKFKFHNEDDGSVFIEVVNIRKLIKVGLFFSDQFQKSRILSRLQKNIRIFKEKQYCDLDYAILLIFDEYFNVRKKNNQSITKTFSKAYQKNKGYFSITEITEVFDCLDNLYRKCQDSTQLFAPQSQLYIGKLYVFSITSGKNNYEIQLNNFLSSVHKFGFDSPYPFIKVPSRKKSAKSGDDFDEESVDNKETPSNNNLSQPSPSKQPIKIQNPGLSDKNVPASNVSLNTTRVDVGSKLFSQHFSILKQLFDYVKIFQQTLKTQKNADILWKSFNQIKVVLERGCTFLKYPLVKQMIK